MPQTIQIDQVENQKDLTTFILFPWQIYQGDPHWVPPLIKDMAAKFHPGHPFLAHSEMALFLARQGDRILGRIAGIIDRNYIEFHQEKTGFFGFFESIEDPQVAEALLAQAKNWLKTRGMQKMIGPLNPSTNDECGLLIDGFGSAPCLMMPYNPAYYIPLLEHGGLKKSMDLYAYLLEKETFRDGRLMRITERLMKKDPDLSVRPIRLNQFTDELKLIKEIYNQAWSKNWGFVPMTEAEIEDTAKNLKPLVVPELTLFVYWKDEPIGFSCSLPDYNEVLKHLNGKIGLIGGLKFLYFKRKIKKVRVMLLGIKEAYRKKGAEGILFAQTFRNGTALGYDHAECSWILENNLLMQHGIEAMGGKRYKTYRVYETGL